VHRAVQEQPDGHGGDDHGRGPGAALCTDAYTADGARRWNDANVLALSLRLTSEPLLKEILDAWFAAEASADAEDRENVARVNRLDHQHGTRTHPERNR
ncbi:RpiB/LacA/LacB family sugar-phosphate isomerase, partial [Streptomyces virginiae]|uniref:RpiB/LacA/LacB family sugar-phosphate isomerase n=1 Tax=Streptomyces virginiae TaxID=1961 RepID=UPI0033BF968A